MSAPTTELPKSGSRLDGRVGLVVDIEPLSSFPARTGAALALLNEYLRLPDGWAHAGGVVPIPLPATLANEVAAFPGAAVPPQGEVFLAMNGAAAVGIAVVVRHTLDTALLKRLFVVPSLRRAGIGQRLAIACVQWGGTAGYSRIALDVLPSRTAAIRLYEGLGFGNTSPFATSVTPMRYLARSTG